MIRLRLSNCTGALFGLVLLSPVRAQALLPFPMTVAPERGPAGCMELIPHLDPIIELGMYSQVTLTNTPLPTGSVSLALQRVPLSFGATQVHVNGQLDPDGLALEGVSLWKGKIVGVDESDVLLGLSPQGCYGWVHDGRERVHIIPNTDDGWERAGVRFVTEAQMAMSPASPTDFCSALEVPGHGAATATPPGVTAELGSGWDIYECPIAIETDYQLFQTFGTLAAEQTYIALLLSAVSDRFEEQVGVILSFPYIGFYTTVNDPWSAQDVPGAGCGDVLNEFQAAWAGNIPGGAALGHFISGVWLGCGVAWVDVLCNPTWGFSLTCCITGGVTFPVTQGGNTQDFYVMAHELGHNFGSLHTHDYCPPLDECATNCNGTTACTSQGTNLSYCHGCPGGYSNITTYFHPVVVQVMRDAVETSCLLTYCRTESFCLANPNSAGPGCSIDSFGSIDISDNNFNLWSSGGVAGQFGFFFYGGAQVQVPGGDGFLCVGSGGFGLHRLLPPTVIDGLGGASRQVDFTTFPAGVGMGAIMPGTSTFFQFWYRDPGGPGGTNYNFSDGLSVVFCP